MAAAANDDYVPFRRTHVIEDDDAEKRNWRIVGFGKNNVTPLNPEAEQAFESIRPQLMSVIRNIPLASVKNRGPSARSPTATVEGYRVTDKKKSNPDRHGVNAVVLTSSSRPFAKEVKKQILRTCILESGRTKFTLVVQDEPPEWDWRADGAVVDAREQPRLLGANPPDHSKGPSAFPILRRWIRLGRSAIRSCLVCCCSSIMRTFRIASTQPRLNKQKEKDLEEMKVKA